MGLRVRPALVLVAMAGLGTLSAPGPRSSVLAQAPSATARTFSVVASRYTFNPLQIEVVQGDVVRIEMQDQHRHSIFGAIEQTVVAAPATH